MQDARDASEFTEVNENANAFLHAACLRNKKENAKSMRRKMYQANKSSRLLMRPFLFPTTHSLRSAQNHEKSWLISSITCVKCIIVISYF